MKDTAVGVAIITALLGAAFYAGTVYEGQEWHLRMSQAKHTVDSLTEVVHQPVAAESVIIYIPSIKPAPDYQAMIDSAVNVARRQGKDSLDRLFTWTAQILDQSYAFPSGDTLDEYYVPLTHYWRPRIRPRPIEIRILTILDSTQYPLPQQKAGRAWYEIPVAVGSGALAAIITMLALRW